MSALLMFDLANYVVKLFNLDPILNRVRYFKWKDTVEQFSYLVFYSAACGLGTRTRLRSAIGEEGFEVLHQNIKCFVIIFWPPNPTLEASKKVL